MPEPSDRIGKDHEFHDVEYVEGWAERFKPTPERLQLFSAMLEELRARVPARARIVELGVGPGYLADYVLRAMSEVRYVGVDFSRPMLEIAQRRLRCHAQRIGYLQADLVVDPWWSRIEGPVDAIVSTWALHDLGSQKNVETVYGHCLRLLGTEGLLLNGDFIKPEKTPHAYEPGRFEIGRHLEMLRELGFHSADCLVLLEEEVDFPNSSQNYACLRGIVYAPAA